jgi:GPH family glycoside/pentoside/hexuronide:cation symporter
MGVITFFTPSFASTGKIVYAYITYSLMMIVYSLINVPYASLLGAISSDPKERNSLSSYRMTFAFIGSFVTFMLLQPLVNFFQKTFDPQHLSESATTTISTSSIAWALGVGTIGILCVVLFFLCFSWTKERVKQIDKEENLSVGNDLKLLFHNSTWWILVATGLAALLFNAMRDGVAIFYFRDYLKTSYIMSGTGWDMTTIYFLIGQAANIIGVIAAPIISAKYGKRLTYMIAILLAGIFSVGFFFVPESITMVLVLQFFTSIFAGYVLPLLWSMFADIVDDHELKTGRRTTGLIFSSSSMSQKLGWALGAAMSGWILAWFHYAPDAAQQSAETIFGEKLMISLLPAICAILAFVGMFFYPLSDKKVKENTEKLNQLRTKN